MAGDLSFLSLKQTNKLKNGRKLKQREHFLKEDIQMAKKIKKKQKTKHNKTELWSEKTKILNKIRTK